ncbi:MAG: SDR family NAD(P)-dependent oxidoreductase [Patescibacteria group bacterium]|nr:SDR family NAD(P)-dependent oxidoreductase [Patescibacteria group bacterium]
MKKRIALITGGSSGIGRQIAMDLAKQGIIVCINYSKSDAMAREVQDQITSSGDVASIFKADVTVESDVIKMYEKIRNEYKGLDILINNAGADAEIPSDIENCDYRVWKKIIDLNLNGKFLCTKHAIHLLKKSKFPSIINIASRAGIEPFNEAACYCCAEAGVIMLTGASALELSRYKIRVNTVSSGLTKTPLTEKFCTNNDFEEYAKNNPSGRIGETKDIANTVLFLISEKAEFINGENINVSGGILLKQFV